MTTQNRELASLIDNSGNVTATGNLTVSGTTTAVSSTNTTVTDPLMELNNGAGSNSNDLGFVFERGSTGDNACLIWDESNDAFAVGTTTATGSSTGNMSYTTGDFLAGKVTVDNVIINGTTIGHTDDTDLMTVADGGLTVAGTIASTGVVTANAGVVVDNITIDGAEFDVSTGDFKFDIEGDLRLDANGGDLIFQDNGTDIGSFTNSSSDFVITSSVQDKDIVFKGDDNGSAITALTLDMSDAGTASFNHDIKLGDNSKVHLGAGTDFSVYHTGSHGYAENNTGDLILLNNANDKDIIFQSDDGAGGTTTYFRLDGSEAAHDGSSTTATYTRFPDLAYLSFGDSKDYNIRHHSNGHTYISGSSVRHGSNAFRVMNLADSETLIEALADGAVTLYYDNTARIATSSTGATVTGALSTTGALTLGDYIEKTSGDLTIDVAGDIILDADGGDFYVKDGGTTLLHLDQYYRLGLGGDATSKLDIHYDSGGFDDSDASSRLASSMMHFQGNNDMRLIFTENGTTYRGMLGYEHAGSSYMGIWDSGSSSTPTLVSQAGKIGIGTTSPSYKAHIQSTSSETTLAIQSNLSPTGSSVGGRLRLQLGAQSNSGSGNADTSAGDYCGQVLFEGQGTDYSYQAGSVNCLVTDGDGDDGRVNQGAALTFGTMKVGATSQVEKMRLTGNGDLCLGGTNDAHTSADIGTSLHILSEQSGTDVSLHLHPDSGEWSLYAYNNYLAILDHANNAERWRMNSSGRQTYNGSSSANAHYNMVGEVGASSKAIAFEHTNGGGEVGTIVTGSSSTTYNTSSDYRLKENIDYTWDATTRLKQLKPARFNWIKDDTNTLLEGFLAHEVSSIVPGAVSGEKDAMTDAILYTDGEELPSGKEVGDIKKASAPDYQGIDHSKLVPLMVKTIQELEARITALES